jgi:uncharacterized protein with FMN-binding domain
MVRQLKKGSIFSICRRLTFAALFLIFCRAGLSQDQALPSRSKPAMSLVEAMNRRMSVRSYKKDPVETGKLSWLLWSTGKISWEGEIPGMIVVKMGNQMFQYDPKSHTLNTPAVQIPELRMYEAPVHLFLMPVDTSKSESDDLWLWRGMAGQAVYLGAPALGLGTVTVRGVGFPVGVPEKETLFQTRPLSENEFLSAVKTLPAASLDTLMAQLSPVPEKTGTLPGEAINRFLWAAYGFSLIQEEGGRIHRSVPSARGRYPMTVYQFSSNGFFQYLPERDSMAILDSSDLRPHLSQSTGISWIEESSDILLIVWDTEKMTGKNSALYEAGAMLFNIQLMSKAMDLPVVWSLMEPDSLVLTGSGIRFSGTQVPLMCVGMGQAAPESESLLKGGVFEGEARNWPEIKVEVTVKEGRIHKIHIVDDRGTPAFTDRMKAVLPQKILESGSTDVDGVSGATLSSDNLKKAVIDALNKAK